jgi:5-methyltetrahydrofolate--homocysteine methyltransferase
MKKALEETPPGPAPTLEEIAAQIGGFSSDSDGTGEGAPAPRRTRRRTRG